MDLICLACLIFLKFPWWPVWVQHFLKGTILSSIICVLLNVQLFSRKTSVAASGSDVWSKMLDQAHLNPLKFLLRWRITRKSSWWSNFLKNLFLFSLKQLVGSKKKHFSRHRWVCISYEKYTKPSTLLLILQIGFSRISKKSLVTQISSFLKRKINTHPHLIDRA